MITYNLNTIMETTVTESGAVVTTTFTIPVDGTGVMVHILDKNRVFINNTVLVFDTRSEYDAYINTLPGA